jgi:hypothetical protein
LPDEHDPFDQTWTLKIRSGELLLFKFNPTPHLADSSPMTFR